MKKVYRLYCIKETEVCIPSGDYYAKGDDWQKETLEVLSFNGEEFETEELALESIEEYFNTFNEVKFEYVILPVYKKK